MAALRTHDQGICRKGVSKWWCNKDNPLIFGIMGSENGWISLQDDPDWTGISFMFLAYKQFDFPFRTQNINIEYLIVIRSDTENYTQLLHYFLMPKSHTIFFSVDGGSVQYWFNTERIPGWESRGTIAFKRDVPFEGTIIYGSSECLKETKS